MPKAKVTLVANLKAGSLEPGLLDKIEAELSKHGQGYNIYDIELVSSKDAVNFGSILCAVGGDGTVNKAARLAVKLDKTLAVIPSGTFNHFAKDLGLPLDPVAATRRIVRGKTHQIDVASVNERVFINNSSIGFYPQAVSVKNKLRHVVGRGLATAASAAYVLRQLKTYNLELVADGQKKNLKTRLLVVANNRYDLKQLGLAARDNLDGGWLYIYSLKPQSTREMAKLGLKLLSGRINKSDVEMFRAKKVIVHTKQAKLKVATDGEVCRLRTPLIYEIEPKTLTVIA